MSLKVKSIGPLISGINGFPPSLTINPASCLTSSLPNFEPKDDNLASKLGLSRTLNKSPYSEITLLTAVSVSVGRIFERLF